MLRLRAAHRRIFRRGPWAETGPWLRSALLSLLALWLVLSSTACRTLSISESGVASTPAVVASSQATVGPEAESPEPARQRQVTVLHINDVYRIGGVDNGQEGGLARLRALRAELEMEAPDLLFMHAGDLLFPSMLSRQFSGAQMIDVLNWMDGDPHRFDERMFATFGNHEFDQGDLEEAPTLDRRIEESAFYWLASNINFQPDVGSKQGVAAWNLIPSRLVDSGGVRVGIFSLSTDMVHPEYVISFDPPEATARRWVQALRQDGAEVVIALTHLPLSEDVALLQALGDDAPDLILGGHEHNWIERQVNGRWILKADAEARSATVVRIGIDPDGAPHIKFERRELAAASAVDAAVQNVVERWAQQHDQEFCSDNLGLSPGCLDDVFGHTLVRLSGEELEIRRYETNLGNWVADRALEGYAAEGAQIAFINSGSLRLNQDIPAKTDITRRHIEETFQFSSYLRRVRVTGAILQRALEHSAAGWTGEGKWLQVAGFAFRHDPSTQKVDRLTLLAPDGPRPIRPDEELLLVTGSYLVDPDRGDQDGYSMLTPEMVIPDSDPLTLKDLVVQKLEATRSQGIAPKVEGRICNTERPGPCLAVASDP